MLNQEEAKWLQYLVKEREYYPTLLRFTIIVDDRASFKARKKCLHSAFIWFHCHFGTGPLWGCFYRYLEAWHFGRPVTKEERDASEICVSFLEQCVDYLEQNHDDLIRGN